MVSQRVAESRIVVGRGFWFCRKVQMETSEFITFCYLRSQGIKLPRRRLGRVPCGHQLALANRVHHFNPRNRTPGRPKRLEAEHRVCDPLHRSMVLFHDIVEILALPDNDSCLVNLMVVINRAAVFAPLLSLVLFSGSPWVRIALWRKASAASRSRAGVSRKSIVWPSLSTSR